MPFVANVAQLVERRLPKPKVAGSKPVVRLAKAQVFWAFVVLGIARSLKYVPNVSRTTASFSAMTALASPLRAMCSALTASAARSSTRSTGCLTDVRSRSGSGRRGPSAAVRQPATSPSAWRRTGCARRSTDARRGTLPGLVRTGATFADAAAEWLRYVEHDRAVKPSTMVDYRSTASSWWRSSGSCGSRTVTAAPDRGSGAPGLGAGREQPLTNRTRNKMLDGARRDHGASAQGVWPAVEPGARCREAARALRRDPVRLLLARGGSSHSSAAAASEQDGAIFLTAAFTGLRRGELIALRWRDVDFERSAIRVSRQLRERQADHTEVRPRTGRADGAGGRSGPGPAWHSGAISLVMTSSCSLASLGRLPRRLSFTAALRRRHVTSRRPPPSPLPRSAPHLRHARRAWRRVDRRAAELAGPRRGTHDDALHALSRAGRRGRSARASVRHGGRADRRPC